MSEEPIKKSRIISKRVIGNLGLWSLPMMMIAQGLEIFEGSGFTNIEQEENVLTFTYLVMDYPILECKATITIETEVLRELK